MHGPLKQTHRIISMTAPCLALLMTTPFAGRADLMKAAAAIDAPAAPAREAEALQRVWQVRDFTTIVLVPREGGASENTHPAAIAAARLRQLLGSVQTRVRGQNTPLLADEELADLAPALSQALARATPSQDILLLSSSRRGGPAGSSPTAVTARLFVVDGRLQIIAHDSRFDFYDAYMQAHEAPQFTFGSRSFTGSALLNCHGASGKRSDWLSLPVGPDPADAPSRLALGHD